MAVSFGDLSRATFKKEFGVPLPEGGGYEQLRCREYPRLVLAKQRTTSRDEEFTTYQVDGTRCTTVAEVIERLNATTPEQEMVS